MEDIIATESWRQIPPEEKLEMMTQAHTTGVSSALCLIIMGATFSIGYQVPELFWISILASPIVFQFAAMRKWRSVRPVLMLMYLAARSASRRYAYAVKSVDMSIRLIFRGTMKRIPTDDSVIGQMDAEVLGAVEIPVWIVLFADCVIVMSEAKGGAKLEFGRLVCDRMSVRLPNPEVDVDRSITITYTDRHEGKEIISLNSYQPAALSVFGSKLNEFLSEPAVTRFDTELLEDQAA